MELTLNIHAPADWPLWIRRAILLLVTLLGIACGSYWFLWGTLEYRQVLRETTAEIHATKDKNRHDDAYLRVWREQNETLETLLERQQKLFNELTVMSVSQAVMGAIAQNGMHLVDLVRQDKELSTQQLVIDIVANGNYVAILNTVIAVFGLPETLYIETLTIKPLDNEILELNLRLQVSKATRQGDSYEVR